MSTTSDAHGSTIQGSGPDAGVFRYQATMSRLATTFTFTERQANSLSDSAREAETLGRKLFLVGLKPFDEDSVIA